MNKLRRFDYAEMPRFVTFSCYHNYNLFKTEEVKDQFVLTVKRLREQYHFGLLGYVVMPNHIHLVLLPEYNVPPSRIIGELKSRSARGIMELWRNKGLQIFDKLRIVKDGKQRFAFWQRRYYDHNCRTRETTIEKIQYCHNNPVKKGLGCPSG
ncbi:MAG: transposase [Candidatus Zixiibacteriota bacterium]